MAQRAFYLTTSTLLLWLLLVPACAPPGGDDDDATDPDVTDDDDDDDDDVVYLPVTFVGEVIGVDRESGEVLSTEDYQSLAGAIVVYLVSDPADLSDPAGKATLQSPGEFSITVDPNPGPLYLLAISDWTKNTIIDPADVVREYVGNPIYSGLGGQQDVEIILDLRIYMDLPGHGGGGSTSATTNISGPVTLVNIDDGPLAVAAFRGDGGGWPTYSTFDQASDYALDVRDTWGLTRVVGFIDKDLNGMFEPSDWTGEVTSNPVQLGIGDLAGAEIVIPSGDPSSLPAPSGYIELLGNVVYDDYSGGDIAMSLSTGGTAGQLYGSATLASPGDFSVRAPVVTTDLYLWAYAEDGAFGVLGPFSTGMGDEVGINLVLEPPQGADNSISGQIDYAGAVSSGDSLIIFSAALKDESSEMVLVIENPVFPVEYEFLGLSAGSFEVLALLDIGSDLDSDPEPDEPWGEWSGPIVLSGGTSAGDISFSLSQLGGWGAARSR
jgi:hypothetical protein